MRSRVTGVSLALIVVGCGTYLGGVVLPQKGAADAEYPTAAALPVVSVSQARIDRVRGNRGQLVCEVKGGQAQVAKELLYDIQENVGMWRAPVIEEGTRCAGALANDPALASVRALILGGTVSAFGVLCDGRGVFLRVNEQCFGPYDRLYRSRFQGLTGPALYGVTAYSDGRAEFIHMTVGSGQGSRLFVLCDLGRYVAPGSGAEFAAEISGTGADVEAYLAPTGVGGSPGGWFVRSPRGPAGSSSCALGRYLPGK